MNRLITTIFLASTCASASVAGSFTAPVVEPAALTPPPVSMADDWSGFYLGGMYSALTGSSEAFQPAGTSIATYTSDQSLYGGFAGYNFQHNALVFGGEIAYSAGQTTYSSPLIPPSTADESYLDAKVRLGFATGNFLVYGTAGSSTLYSTSTRSITMPGFNYGAGAALKFNNGFFVGAEFLARNVSGIEPLDPTVSYTYTNQSISLRLGKQF